MIRMILPCIIDLIKVRWLFNFFFEIDVSENQSVVKQAFSTSLLSETENDERTGRKSERMNHVDYNPVFQPHPHQSE